MGTDTKIKYTCDADYSLKWGENDVRVCGKHGNWDNNTVPECVPLCLAPPKVINSNLVTIKKEMLFDGSFADSIVQYKCKEGYVIDYESKNITNCGLDGKWDLLELPKCLKECNNQLKNLPNGRVIITNELRLNKTIVGTNITFECDYEYKLSSNISKYICQANGTWNNKIRNLTCLKVDYKFNITPEAGNFSYARQQCIEMGGDLITAIMGPQGKKYHDEIRSALNKWYDRIDLLHTWVGIVDYGAEKYLRFITHNTRLNPNKANQLFSLDKDNFCVAVSVGNYGSLMLNTDVFHCSYKLFGLCELQLN